MKKNLLIQFLLGSCCIFLPFIFMKIGPGGYKFYGPDVPDIYIFGGYIFGKDVSWPGINFAYKFQLVCLLIFSGIALFCYIKSSKIRMIIRFQVLLSFMILLFPLWIWLYSGGVYNNSDGADLTIYPHIGWIAYISLIYIQIRIYRRAYQLNRINHGIQTSSIYNQRP